MHAPPCPECGGDGRFIPGAYYSAAFVETVERAIEIVYSARLSAFVAQEAAQTLGQSLADPSPSRLRALIARYEGLHSLRGMLPEVITAANVREARNLIGLVAALLPACAPVGRSPAGDATRGSEAPPPVSESSSEGSTEVTDSSNQGESRSA